MRLTDADVLMDLYANRLELLAERYGLDSSECGVLAGAMKLLEAQPTIEEWKTGKWIPCSETVDIPDHEVLACDKYGEYIIGLLAYEGEQWLCESEETMMYDPTAWMPLPEPYGGGEDHDC